MAVADLTAYSASGATLNAEERASLSISLPLLKEAQQAPEVGFWGKIQGVQKDYYIAWSGKAVGGSRKWFFSHDAKTWQILPQVGLLEAKAFDVVAAQRFLGDPAFEYEHAVVDGKVQNEEKRLAYTVKKIDQDTAVAPRGAFIQVANGAVIQNPSFSGLSSSDCRSLKNWLHYRQESTDRNSDNILGRENLDTAADIFENLEVDQPKGTWTLRAEKGESLVLARNLAWPGSVAYHQQDLNSKQASWGYMYIGQGVKNVDLGFMV